MPYKNLPDDPETQGRMERCVKKVMADGKSKQSAIAICYTSLTKGKSIEDATHFVVSMKEANQAACNYRKADAAQKSIGDVPHLRGYEDRTCANCKWHKPLPMTEVEEEVEDIAESVPMAETEKASGICSKYDFATDSAWLCDTWESQMPAEYSLPIQEKSAESFATFKQADGHYRWLIVSSSSYKDRDGEIVSQRALESDTERMNKEAKYGDLDWYHTPVKLGTCDFSAMHGRFSVESGTFNDDWVGEHISEIQKELGASRSFYHPATEPDAQGVYNNIQTFARAILPADKASNRFTKVLVTKKENDMLPEKVQWLVDKFKGKPDAEPHIQAILAQLEKEDKAAEPVVAHKEVDAPPAAPPEPETAKTDKDDEAEFVGALTATEFADVTAKAIRDALAPMFEQMKAELGKVADTTKAATEKAANEQAQRQVKIAEMQTALDARLKALEGEQPRGYRPSQDPTTVTTNEALKAAMPKQDPYLKTFIDGWVMQGDQPQPPPK